MTRACLEFSRLWDDVDFFEIKMLARSPDCQIDINFYTTNEELEMLRKGITQLKKNEEFVWTSGEDTDNVSHYIYFRFFFCSKRGHVAIEILTDNKSEPPYHTRANFYIISEFGSLDDFTNQLEKFVKGIENYVKGIMFVQP